MTKIAYLPGVFMGITSSIPKILKALGNVFVIKNKQDINTDWKLLFSNS